MAGRKADAIVPPVQPPETINDWAIHGAENLPNHTASQRGRGKFVRQGLAEVPTFRTRQEAFRYAAWLVTVADIHLPDEDGCEGQDFDAILTAVRNT
jgi:hypothetical protein